RSSRRAITSPARSSARVWASEPLWARPTAERTISAITISVMVVYLLFADSRSVSQRFVLFQHVPHAVLSFWLGAQAHERFALQVQNILFGDIARRAPYATAQDTGQLLGNE